MPIVVDIVHLSSPAESMAVTGPPAPIPVVRAARSRRFVPKTAPAAPAAPPASEPVEEAKSEPVEEAKVTGSVIDTGGDDDGTGFGGGRDDGNGRGNVLGDDEGEGSQFIAAVNEYLGLVRHRIDQRKSYPAAARRLGMEGRVTAKVGIRADGQLLFVAILASDQELLAQEVRNAVARAAPFPPLPNQLGRRRIELVVPLRFRLSGDEEPW